MKTARYQIHIGGRRVWATLAYAGWSKNQMNLGKPLIHKGRKP